MTELDRRYCAPRDVSEHESVLYEETRTTDYWAKWSEGRVSCIIWRDDNWECAGLVVVWDIPPISLGVAHGWILPSFGSSASIEGVSYDMGFRSYAYSRDLAESTNMLRELGQKSALEYERIAKLCAVVADKRRISTPWEHRP